MRELDAQELKEIEQGFASVPFGQSVFQNLNLADDAATPARKLRYCLLQLQAKITALKKAEFDGRRLELDLAAARRRLRFLIFVPFAWISRRRIEIDIEEKEWARARGVKLVEDALIEARTFYESFKALPRITREDFENEELEHWRTKFMRAAELEVQAHGFISPAAMDALLKVGIAAVKDGDQIKLFEEQKVLPAPVNRP